MLPRQGVIAALRNAQKQTQGGCQKEETQEHGPNERTDQKSRKVTKQNGDKQSIRCRAQNTGYKDAEELSEDLNSIKKIQSEMKDTLIEIKNNLQGNNSRVYSILLSRIKSMIWNIRKKKNNYSEQQ